jgi:hypothetical protein
MKVQLLNKDIISLIYIGHLDSYAFGLLDLGTSFIPSEILGFSRDVLFGW